LSANAGCSPTQDADRRSAPSDLGFAVNFKSREATGPLLGAWELGSLGAAARQSRFMPPTGKALLDQFVTQQAAIIA
jgi:hypothetical protein